MYATPILTTIPERTFSILKPVQKLIWGTRNESENFDKNFTIRKSVSRT